MRHPRFLKLWLFLLPAIAFGQTVSLADDEARFLSELPPLKIMVDDSFPPLSRWNERLGVYEGIGVDLFKQAAARLGLKYVFLHNPEMTWLQKVAQFQAGSIDALVPVSITPEREAAGIFTSTYYESTYTAIARQASGLKIKATGDLAASRVGAVQGTAIVPYLQRMMPNGRILQFPTTAEAYQALRDAKIDFVMQNTLVFEEERYEQELFDLEAVYVLAEWPRRYAFYFRSTPKMAHLVPLLDHAMTGIDVSSLAKRYGRGAEDLILRYTEQKHRQDLLMVVLAASVGLLFLLGLILWNQRRLRETEARYRALADASFGGIAIHESSIVLECNQGLSDLTGYSREELLGMNGMGLIAPESRQIALNHIISGSTERYEVQGLRRDGSQFPVGVRGRSVPYQGRTVRVTEFVDLSDFRRAEDAIRKAKAQYDDLVAKIPMGIYLLRSAPDGSFRFEFVSPRMSDILGYSVEDLLADPVNAFEAIDPGERAAFEASNLHALLTGEPFDWTGRASRSGQPRWFHIASTPERQNDGDLLWHGTLTDITEQKVAEDKIAALLEEKELVLKEVHHRIKNNMSTVSGLLTLQGATLSDPASVEALEAAKGRVLSMMVLYDKLYMSADNQAVSLKEFMPSLVDEVLNNFPNVGSVSYRTEAEDIVLDAKLLSSLGIIVNELLTNVMKYAFQGRTSGTIFVQCTRSDGIIRVAVQDNGRGIPEDFDLSQSSGFGLSLVEMLIKHLKGKITVLREKGTTFVLEFPG